MYNVQYYVMGLTMIIYNHYQSAVPQGPNRLSQQRSWLPCAVFHLPAEANLATASLSIARYWHH